MLDYFIKTFISLLREKNIDQDVLELIQNVIIDALTIVVKKQFKK